MNSIYDNYLKTEASEIEATTIQEETTTAESKFTFPSAGESIWLTIRSGFTIGLIILIAIGWRKFKERKHAAKYKKMDAKNEQSKTDDINARFYRNKNQIYEYIKSCPCVKKVYNNFYLPTEDGKFENIDILAVTNKAIYIFRTPFVSVCDETLVAPSLENKEWRMSEYLTLNNYNSPERFLPMASPTKDNINKINLFRRVLGSAINNIPIVNCIAFDNDCAIKISNYSHAALCSAAIVNSFSVYKMFNHYEEKLKNEQNISIAELDMALKPYTKQSKDILSKIKKPIDYYNENKALIPIDNRKKWLKEGGVNLCRNEMYHEYYDKVMVPNMLRRYKKSERTYTEQDSLEGKEFERNLIHQDWYIEAATKEALSGKIYPYKLTRLDGGEVRDLEASLGIPPRKQRLKSGEIV